MPAGGPPRTRTAADRAGIRELLADVHDHGLLQHACTPSMRDHELESNAHRIRLVFSELRVRTVQVGCTPFVV